MPSFKTILFGNLSVEVELDSDGLIETVCDEAGNELEFHDTLFKDEKGAFVPIDTLLYDKISEAIWEHRVCEKARHHDMAVADRLER